MHSLVASHQIQMSMSLTRQLHRVKQPQPILPAMYEPIGQNFAQLSPWNSEQYKRTFDPEHFYEHASFEHRNVKKSSASRSMSVPRNNIFGERISQDFIQLVKLQTTGAYIHQAKEKQSKQIMLKMNLVNVNLDEELIYSPEKKYGQTGNQFYCQNHRARIIKEREQPVKVRIFKKIQAKNNLRNEQDQHQHGETLSAFIREEGSETMNLYSSMPKRQPRYAENKKKSHWTIQPRQTELLPKISIEKETSTIKELHSEEGIYCRGEVVPHRQKWKLKRCYLQTNLSHYTRNRKNADHES